MRHVVVTRCVLAIGLLLAGACLLFARAASRRSPATPAAPTGAALFEQRCAACHVAADVGASLRSPAELRDASEALRSFLRSHGHSAPGEEGPLVDFLAARAQDG